MAAEVRRYAITVPHGTAILSPAETDLELYGRMVREFAVRFPPGAAALVGCRLFSAGVQVAPREGWFIGNDEVQAWAFDRDVPRDDWRMRAYNLGVYDHTLLVTVGVDRLVRPSVRTAR